MTDLGSMTTEEALAHYGKKGMKWGVTNKPTRTDIVKARRNVRDQQEALADQRGTIRSKKFTGSKESVAKEKAKYQNMKTSFLKDPDRVTSMRLTKGEAVILTLFASPAYVPANAATRRTIEKRQANGHYDRVAKNRAANARTAAR